MYSCVVSIFGYARSLKTDAEFREQIRRYLKGDDAIVARFLDKCYYRSGDYDSDSAMAAVAAVR